MDRKYFTNVYSEGSNERFYINRISDLNHIDKICPKQMVLFPYTKGIHPALHDLRQAIHIRCTVFEDRQFMGYTKRDMSDSFELRVDDDNVLHITNIGTNIKWSLILMALGVVGCDAFVYA